MNYLKFISLFIFTLFLFSCDNKNKDVFSAVFAEGELAQATILSNSTYILN